MTMHISKLSITQLEKLKSDVESQLSILKYSDKLNKKHTKEEIVAMFSRFGYEVPPGAKIWKICTSENPGAYGMEVGSFIHSCHIDVNEVKVLLVIDGDKHFEKGYFDHWLSDLIVV